jgi:hypothetical protein
VNVPGPDPGAPVDAESPRADASDIPRRLRIGLLLDDCAPSAWVESVLTQIIAERIGELAVIVLNAAPPEAAPARPRSLRRRIGTWYRNRHSLAYALYERVDAHRYGTDDDPTRAVDASKVLQGVPVIRVEPRMTRFCDYFDDSDVAEIVRYDLDVALRFGFRILKGRSLSIARHGVWSFHHGDNTVNRGGPPGFWEVMERHDVTGSVLQRLTEDLDGGQVLGSTFASTNRFSPTANRANYYPQASQLLVARLRELADRVTCEMSEQALSGGAESTPIWSSYSNRLYVRPRTTEVFRGTARLAMRLVVSKLRSLFVREQWLIAYRLSPDRGSTGDVPDGVFYRFKELVPPHDRFWADPFPVYADGRHFLFFEEHVYSQPHAHINVAEIGPAGMIGPPRTVLKCAYHLSYPSVFEWDGAWYMTPETAERRSVQLFRAESFPDKWVFVGDLLTDVDAVDPTVASIDGRWWMFIAVTAPGASEAAALHLYSSSTPLGPWVPHRRNPVKVDVRGARPGGRVFKMHGRYYRVGQDGAPTYGSGLRVFAIDQLDDTTFRETEVSRITPRWRPGLVGAHTLNASGGLTAVDLRQTRYRF